MLCFCVIPSHCLTPLSVLEPCKDPVLHSCWPHLFKKMAIWSTLLQPVCWDNLLWNYINLSFKLDLHTIVGFPISFLSLAQFPFFYVIRPSSYPEHLYPSPLLCRPLHPKWPAGLALFSSLTCIQCSVVDLPISPSYSSPLKFCSQRVSKPSITACTGSSVTMRNWQKLSPPPPF